MMNDKPCTKCKYYKGKPDSRFDECAHPKAYSDVTGRTIHEHIFCWINRTSYGICDRTGRLFEPIDEIKTKKSLWSRLFGG